MNLLLSRARPRGVREGSVVENVILSSVPGRSDSRVVDGSWTKNATCKLVPELC
jgi:hypothetical protein